MATGGWGGTLGAWAHAKEKDAEDEMPIKAGTVSQQMSEVELGSSSAAPASKAVISSMTTAYYNISRPWHNTAPAYSSNAAAAASAAGQLNMGAAPIAAREAAVAQREAALRTKEKELEAREAELRRNGVQFRKNWPVCFPVVHHDIAKDIPQDMQGMVRLAYWCYLGLCVCLLYNFVAACAMIGFNAPDKMSSWFLAAIYMLSGVPLGLMLWYMKLYNTVASNGSVGMLGFFIFFMIHVAFCTWAAIAPPLAGERWSFTGFVAALRAFDVGKAGGIIYIIGSCMWTLEALASWWCLKTVYFSFRSSGKQQQTQNELTKMALKAAMENKA